MPRAKKNRSPLPSRVCPVCEVEFVPTAAAQRYCDDHKNRHAKQATDRRRLGAAERPADYYRAKPCQACGATFTPRTGSARYCPACQGVDRWKLKNPELARSLARRRTRRHRHKRDFGEADIYERLVERDGEVCRICGASPAETGWHLAVDHDHDSGEVRGLLCPRCNTGLGYFRHDPDRLEAAAAFLRRSVLVTGM